MSSFWARGDTGDGRLGRFWLVLAGTAGPFVQFGFWEIDFAGSHSSKKTGAIFGW